MAQFDPVLLNAKDGLVNLSVFSGEEWALINEYTKQVYGRPVFSASEMMHLGILRSTYEQVLREQGPQAAVGAFENGTNYVRGQLEWLGYGTTLYDVESLWNDVPKPQGYEVPLPVNKDNFDLQMQNQMVSDLGTRMERSKEDYNSILDNLRSDQNFQPDKIIRLVKAAYGGDQATPLHSNAKFGAAVAAPLLDLRRSDLRKVITRLNMAFTAMTTQVRPLMARRMGLMSYWNQASAHVGNFCQAIEKDLTSDAMAPYPSKESVAARTFQAITQSLYKNLDDADPNPDLTRLDIAAVLLNGSPNVRANPNSGEHYLAQLLRKGESTKVNKEMVQIVTDALKTEDPNTMRLVSTPIIDAIYGVGAAKSYMKLQKAQQDMFNGTGIGKTGVTTKIGKETKRPETKEKVEQKKKELEAANRQAAAQNGAIQFAAGALNMNPGDAAKVAIKGMADNAASSVRGLLGATPWTSWMTPVTDVIMTDLVANPLNGAAAACAPLLGTAINEGIQSLITGQPMRSFGEAKTPLDVLGVIGQTALRGAFPWLMPPEKRDVSPPQPPISGTKAFSDWLGVVDASVDAAGPSRINTGSGLVRINNAFIDADFNTKFGTLPKPTMAFTDEKGNILYNFKLLPSVKVTSSLQGNLDGQEVPFPSYGIHYKHVQNIASLDVPGAGPMFQSLGVVAEIIEVVGEVISYGFRGANGSKDYILGAFPYGPNPNPERVGGSDKAYAAASVSNATERTAYRAYGAWTETEEGMGKLVRSGSPVWFRVSYHAANHGETEADKKITPINHKVYIQQIQRIHARRDKVYYKITMLRASFPEAMIAAKNVTSWAQQAAQLTQERTDLVNQAMINTAKQEQIAADALRAQQNTTTETLGAALSATNPAAQLAATNTIQGVQIVDSFIPQQQGVLNTQNAIGLTTEKGGNAVLAAGVWDGNTAIVQYPILKQDGTPINVQTRFTITDDKVAKAFGAGDQAATQTVSNLARQVASLEQATLRDDLKARIPQPPAEAPSETTDAEGSDSGATPSP